ncbi:MAG: hypothetical protein Q9183_005009 [Haloplaca sp. 2 TL-2023]
MGVVSSKGSKAKDALKSPKPMGASSKVFEVMESSSKESGAMDSSLWGRLPLEIQCLIVEHSEYQTLLNWSCTSQFFYEIATNCLWESYTITSDDLNEYCRGDHNSWTSLGSSAVTLGSLQRKDEAVLGLLFKDALRQPSTLWPVGFPKVYGQTAKLPGSRIKTLRLDYAYSDPEEVDAASMLISEREAFESATKEIFAVMPNLRACSVDGQPFHPEILNQTTRVLQLRALTIRSEMQTVHGYWRDDLPPSSLLLDFEKVAHLTQLRNLTVGRLAPRETTGLALAVHNLEGLTELSVSALPPVGDNDIWIEDAGSCRIESPVIMFLDKLWSLGRAAKNDKSHALPWGLKHLVLRDFYRPVLIKDHSILHQTITPCSDLETLRISILGIDHVKYFLSNGYLPRLTDFAIGICTHVLDHDTWYALRLNIPHPDFLQPKKKPSLTSFVRHHQRTLKRLTMNLLASYDDPSEEKGVVLGEWQLRTLAGMKRKMDSVRAAEELDDSLADPKFVNVRQWRQGNWNCKRHGACFLRNRPRAMEMTDLEEFPEFYPE